MREGWLGRGQEGVAFAAPAAPVSFGQKRAPFTLVVDLAQDIGSGRWWRGAATLGALAAALGLLAPGIDPLPSRKNSVFPRAVAEEWRAGGVGTLSSGSRSGIRMAPGSNVELIATVPERAEVQTKLMLGKDGIGPALVRAGASYADSIAVSAMVRTANVPIAPGTPVELTLGRREAGRRSIERVAFRAGLDLRLLIHRTGGALSLRKIALKVDERPLRLRGVAGDGLYWALRNAGASAMTAADYLKALASEIDVGEIGPQDRFDLVFANRRTADGLGKAGMLLYAAIDRTSASDLQLVRWTAGGKPIWVNAATIGERREDDDAMAWPVDAPITSRFGLRVHPILRFARMHRGIDFGARWGTPIHAAADGQVTRAGWAGGYGRQVRLAHGDGTATSYSHMSSMTVEPGAFVRRGQLIGYVGSSGLSTGPHLHYEVYRGGVAVDPLSVRFVTSRPIDPATVAAIKARVKQLAP
ncbi:M23 family metallopeptidase [Sphingomonas sp. HDW15A]|uniref:M23 family metallopeptidase n=1 Tax=Sphingomonas sp. HDW15A TaxID=2714942 RepID=UPI001409B716|nr:M23 family metallopeptidase [Sphingomonas sp. HDW15A]QIK96902.1 M23 family metallopeptidase [Sphingomonas sp. HDW15A]